MTAPTLSAALTLMNGDFMVSQAKQLAALARTENPNDASRQLEFVWRRTLGRSPKAAERDKAMALGLDQLCLALLNTNEFLYLD